MTVKNSQSIACMDCKQEGAFEFYGHIDAGTDPALKVLVKNYELFKFTCPHCGSEQFVNYSFIYQDSDKGVVLYHLQSPEEIDEARAKWAQENEGPASAEGKYRRLVVGPDALVEKIRIFDAGYDDRVIELYKIFLYGQLRDQLAQAAGGDTVEASGRQSALCFCWRRACHRRNCAEHGSICTDSRRLQGQARPICGR